MITAKPSPLGFLDVSMYIGILLKYYCDIIFKKELRIIVLSVVCLQWLVSCVSVLGDHSLGIEEC